MNDKKWQLEVLRVAIHNALNTLGMRLAWSDGEPIEEWYEGRVEDLATLVQHNIDTTPPQDTRSACERNGGCARCNWGAADH